MAIDKLIPQYLNKDEDARLIKGIEMSDALNVRVSHESDGDQGILKNILGNTAIAANSTSDAIPSGSGFDGINVVIGSVASEKGKCIYFFLCNIGGTHGIYQYKHTTNTYFKVYENSILNFNYLDFVKADVVINQFGEHLLYFTDNRNEPRKINATRALEGGYSPSIQTAASAELYLTVCKQPPQVPITFEFQTVDDIPNNLKKDLFQFTYQYVYDDGEVSALSMYSQIAASNTHLAFTAGAQQFLEGFDNQLELTVTMSDGPVTKIRIFARRNNEGAFFRIGEIDNFGPGTQQFLFRNDGVYTFAPDQEVNKLYDSVPRKAFTQAISNNRIFYGNYLEGFDNITTDTFSYPVFFPAASSSGLSNIDIGNGLAQVSDFSIYQNNLTIPPDEIVINGNILNPPFTPYFAAIPSADGGFQEFRYKVYAMHGIENQNSNLNEFGLEFAGPFDIFSSTEMPIQDTFDQHTDGIHFEIDLSQIQGVLENNNNGVIDFNTQLSCDEFMIASHGTTPGAQFSFTTDCTVTEDPDGEGGETFELHYLDPNHERNNISRLRPTSPINFSEVISYDGSANTVEQFAEILAAGLIGTDAVVQVKNLTPSEFIEEVSGTMSDTIAAYSQAGTCLNGFLGASNGSNLQRIWLWFTGQLRFEIFETSFNSDTQHLRCKVRMSFAELKAYRGFADRSGTTTGAAGTTNELIIGNAPQSGGSPQGVLFPGTGYTGKLYTGSQINCVLGGIDTNGLGNTLRDNFVSPLNKLTTYWNNYACKGGNVIVTQLGSEPTFSFKAAATHQFGIVYFDHRNRPSAVQKIDDINVHAFGHHKRNGNEGPTHIDIKVLHEPPYWATKWAPVYGLNTTYETVLQVSVAEAAIGTTTIHNDGIYNESVEKIVEALLTSVDSKIYISMRPLEGKVNSYKEFKASLKTYEYKEGDILRVLMYRDENNNLQRPNYDFEITSYKFYQDNKENPITLSDTNINGVSQPTDEQAYRRTGWWLSIKDNKIPGFSKNDILDGKDLFSQRCIVEIYRPKKSVEQRVYYEIGKKFDIVTVPEGFRTHGGDRSNSVSQSFFMVTSGSTSTFSSAHRLYRGDRVTTTASPSGYLFINLVIPSSANEFTYIVHPSNPLDPTATGLFAGEVIDDVNNNNSIFPGVITLDRGDVFYRLREMLVNAQVEQYTGVLGDINFKYDPTQVDQQEYDAFFIEDFSASDFFDSKAVDIGRAHIEMPDTGEVQRVSSVTYSDVTPADSLRNFYSSFNPSLFPFKDYNSLHGSICYIVDQNESIMVLQENKVVSTPIGRTLIEDAGGGQLVTSTSVLGTDTFYAGDYGPGMQPESVQDIFGKVYFADVSSGVVVEISGKGINTISSASMESYFSNKFSELSSLSQSLKLPGGYDPDNDEYILTIRDIHTARVSVPAENGGTLSTVQKSTISTASQSNTTFSDGLVDVIYKKGGQNTWELCADNFQLDSSNWEDSGNGVVFLDKLGEKGSAYVDTSYRASTGSINIKFMTGNGALIGYGSLSLIDNSIDIPTTVINQSDGSSVAVTVTGTDNHVSPETLAYSTKKNFWLTFYSFLPSLYEHLHNRFFSFLGGQIYRHNVNETRNNFYGVQYSSTLNMISRANPSDIKVYDAMSLEGNSSWSAVVSNTEQTTGTMDSTEFEEREGMYYRQIEKDTTANSTSNTSHKVVLGQVDSVSGSTITFTSKISNLPFGIGDTLFKLESSSETSLSVTLSSVSGRKQVTASGTVSNLSAGDTVMAVSTASINGDKMRDYHAQVALTNGATTPVELFAVNMVYKSSPLHNNSSIPTENKK